jgi:hypothetical protein
LKSELAAAATSLQCSTWHVFLLRESSSWAIPYMSL